MNHNHRFTDANITFGFEDELVTMFITCDDEHCDAIKRTQYTVDFEAFKNSSGDVYTKQYAHNVWNKICDRFEAPAQVTNEIWASGVVKLSTENGEITVEYGDSIEDLKQIQVTMDEYTVKMEVEFYRELQVK